MKKLILICGLIFATLFSYSQSDTTEYVRNKKTGYQDIIRSSFTNLVGTNLILGKIRLYDAGTYGRLLYNSVENMRFNATYTTFFQNVTIGTLPATKNLIVYGDINATYDVSVGGDLSVTGTGNFGDTAYFNNAGDTAYIYNHTDTTHLFSENPFSVETPSATIRGDFNVTGNTTLGDTLFIFNDTLTSLLNIDSLTANVIKTDTLIMGNDTIINIAVDIVDDGYYDLPTGRTIKGSFFIKNGTNRADFFIQTDATVSLDYYTDVVSTDTDVKMCIFDNTTFARIRNRLGSTKTVIISYAF